MVALTEFLWNAGSVLLVCGVCLAAIAVASLLVHWMLEALD